MGVTVTLNDGFRPLLDEIKAKRPDLHNDPQAVSEAIRMYARQLKDGRDPIVNSLYSYLFGGPPSGVGDPAVSAQQRFLIGDEKAQI
jgi:hypothetical protein